MAPLSTIPGRIRLESHELIGKGYCCMALINKINKVNGVKETNINPRTGRILIIFDDLRIKSDDLITKVNEFLNEMKSEPYLKTYMPLVKGDVNKTLYLNAGKNEKRIGNAFIYAVIDIAGHALLPKPFGILLPLAIHAVRAYPKAV